MSDLYTAQTPGEWDVAGNWLKNGLANATGSPPGGLATDAVVISIPMTDADYYVYGITLDSLIINSGGSLDDTGVQDFDYFSTTNDLTVNGTLGLPISGSGINAVVGGNLAVGSTGKMYCYASPFLVSGSFTVASGGVLTNDDGSSPITVSLIGFGNLNVSGSLPDVLVMINTLGAYTLTACNTSLFLQVGVVNGNGASAIGGAFAMSNGTINLACNVDSLNVTGAATFTGGTLNLTGTGTAGAKTVMTTTTGITGTPTLGTLPTGFTAPAGLVVSGNNLQVTLVANPTITNVSPNSGSTAGGDNVTLTGTGFLDLTALTFGGVACTNYTVTSDTSMIAVSPAHGAGTVDVVFTNSAGTSPTSSADHFTYTSGGGSTGGEVLGSGIIFHG